MKIYFPKDHYNSAYRGYVFPLLKPFIKPGDFKDSERIAMYGVSETDYLIEDDLNSADVAILPMSWNYYVLTKQSKLAKDFITHAMQLNKTVWITNVLDSPLKLPEFKNCVLFEPGIYASEFKPYQRVMPIFIKDPLKVYYNRSNPFKRSYGSIPTVGFCGLADGSILNKQVTLIKIGFRNLASYLGIRHLKPERLVAASYLRHRIMRIIKQSEQLKTDFIIRSHYSAGKQSTDKIHNTTLEFYDNIKDSDYVLCVRGAGNFSVRFYETLAMGRIPVFINTDSALPLADQIAWKNHVVWVEHDELHLLEKKIISFHHQLNNQKLNDLFNSNRRLWETKLCLAHYFKLIFNDN